MSRFSEHATSNEEPNIVACFFIVGLFAEPMVFTFTVTREGLKPEFFNEFGENSLIGGNPLSADFKECAVNMVVPCAPAYTFTRFKDCNGMSCLLQSVCCSESGRTCADNYDVSGQFIRSFVLGRPG